LKNSAKESSEKLKILVVEENQEACSALEELLKVLGHSVMITQDGEDALDMFHETTPDLVFSGLTLPKLGGMELLREVKSASGKTLFVMICPMSDPEKIQQALKKGAADFLTRPIQSRELIRSLDRLVNLKKGFITSPRVNETTPNPESDELRISQGGWRKELIEESKTLEIDNNFENLYPLVNFLTEDLSGYQILEEEELIPLKTLLTEALENAIFHGNLELPSELRLENSELFFETAKQKSCLEPYQNRRIVIQYDISRNSLKYIIRDEGKGFEHSEIPDPIDPQNLFQLQGRGILRIALFMDEMFWNEKGNEITMIRYKKRKSSS